MPDGPPWTVGTNCNITLRHVDVNGNSAQGFYVKPDSFRALLPKVWHRGAQTPALLPVGQIATGKRVLEFLVVCEDGRVDKAGAPHESTAAQWHSRLLDYLGRVNQAHTLVDPGGASWAVAWEEWEDRLSPLSGLWLMRWETRIIALEL